MSGIDHSSMKDKQKVTAVLVFTMLFTVLFYQQSIGLNLLIYETCYLGLIAFFAGKSIRSSLAITLFAGTLLTAVFTVITNSVFVIMMNVVSVMLLSGILIFPEAVSVITVAGLAFYNLLLSQIESVRKLTDVRGRLNPPHVE